MTRQCARPGCSHPAVATLIYDYSNQAAWLERLSYEPHPMTHDLCEAHADRMSVPQGWRLEDRRMVAPLAPPAPPAATADDDADLVAPTVGLFHSQLAS